MLEYIEFTSNRFEKKNNYNIIEFTDNTIIICNNYKLLDTLANEIVNTVNGNAEYNKYWCEDEDVNKAKIVLSFGLQRIIEINKQRITIGLEPSLVYKANNLEDIWLFNCKGSNEIEYLPEYKEYIYPIAIYKDSDRDWNLGKDEIYRNITNGRYGCYDGGWVDINNTRIKLNEYIDKLEDEYYEIKELVENQNNDDEKL